MKISHFYVTAHAQQRSLERDLSLELMENVIEIHTARREVRRPGVNGGIVYQFTRASADETITVIAEVRKTECWLVTAYRS